MAPKPVQSHELQAVSPIDQQVLEILLTSKVISYSILRYLIDYMLTWHTDALNAIRETHLASESRVADAFATSLQIARVYQLHQSTLAASSPTCLPFHQARQLPAILVKEEPAVDHENVELVCANPCMQDVFRAIEKTLGFKPRLAVAEAREIRRAIDHLYPLSDQFPAVKTCHP